MHDPPGGNADASVLAKRTLALTLCLVLVAVIVSWFATCRAPLGERARDAARDAGRHSRAQAPEGIESNTARPARKSMQGSLYGATQQAASAPSVHAGPADDTQAHAEGPARIDVAGSPIGTLTPPGAWHAVGLCHASSIAEQLASRRRQQQMFVKHQFETVTIYSDPQVSEGSVTALVSRLKYAARQVHAALGVEGEWPELYVYRDATALGRWACLAEGVVAYYDGAIHLVIDTRSAQTYSLVHEYVHHVLASVGIREPFWFQEGAAIHVAGETWWEQSWLNGRLARAIPLDDMVESAAHGQREDLVVERYVQAALMVEFVRTLSGVQLRDQVAALRAGVVTPSELFAWSSRSDLPSLDAAFRELVDTRGRDAPWQEWRRRHASR